MRKTKTGLSVAACVAATVGLVPSAFSQATIIYDNTSGYLGQQTAPAVTAGVTTYNYEVGDVVKFASGTTDRLLTEFAFEYFMTSGTSGNEMGKLYIRSVLPDGVSPDGILYESQPFTLLSGFHTQYIPGLSTALPDTVAWTIEFTGFEGSEQVGILYDNSGSQLVGQNVTFMGQDFTIQRISGGGYSLVDADGVVDNLTARFTAVPEPGTWALILTGLAGFGFLRRRKS